MSELGYQAILAVIADGRTVSEVAKQWKVSRQTAHTWLARYELEGLEGLADRLRRPASCPNKMPANVEGAILEVRRMKPYWGPHSVGLELARRQVEPMPSRSAIYRCLVRAGVIEPVSRHRRQEHRKRWERARAMELWQMDTVGGFLLADGTTAKALCSGMHRYVDFRDPVAKDDHETTLFEWAGGLPALTRMTRLLYEKYVPQDPLLAPLFAGMSPDHPERVAAWLAEVFCGPKQYSENHGGYSRMISQHVGKGLTEEKRARWVELMLRSSLEAGLPNDAEFRSTFSSYIEWGSRLAVENSTDGAHPPESMPMPKWDWNTAAGPPGSRASALSPAADEPEQPVALPKYAEPVTFEAHIRPLFRSRDRQSMRFAFDLWSYEDVTQHAIEILARLESGSMPCDGAWPKARIDVVRRWIESNQAP